MEWILAKIAVPARCKTYLVTVEYSNIINPEHSKTVREVRHSGYSSLEGWSNTKNLLQQKGEVIAWMPDPEPLGTTENESLYYKMI